MGMPHNEVEALAERLLSEACDDHVRWTDLDDHEHDWLEHAPEQVLQIMAENRLLQERVETLEREAHPKSVTVDEAEPAGELGPLEPGGDPFRWGPGQGYGDRAHAESWRRFRKAELAAGNAAKRLVPELCTRR